MRRPVQVSIYVADGCWAGVAILIKEFLAVAGTLQSRSADLSESELFHISMVGPDHAPALSFTGIPLLPDSVISKSGKGMPAPDVIIIPPYYFLDAQPALMRASLRRWLKNAYDNGAIMMGMDGGVRVLAASGLLNGHEVTGNPSDKKVFAHHYPQIRFSPHVPLIVDGRIISATGTAPCMDACAYLVSQFYGDAAAHKFTRYTNPAHRPAYERSELSNAEWKKHADHRVKQAQEFIERHFKQDISVDDVARHASMSLRNFSRRFQLAVGMSALHYVAHCRIEHAKKLLEMRRGPVLQIAHESGFNNEASFRRTFLQLCAKTPMQYRKATAAKNTAADTITSATTTTTATTHV